MSERPKRWIGRVEGRRRKMKDRNYRNGVFEK